ncbi:MAG: SIS domain-containing protein [Pleurocapsa minor GSE-CHR-MK-17-07R]|jgi:uncharacterized phosphosugar-binding protein|nr:SIS domain-containing protein [Pleurocapsa minor GSE-CHR-MK 17-07R]
MIGRAFSAFAALLSELEARNADALERAAQQMADALASDHLLYTFGTGHSASVAAEFFHRAGGLVPVSPIHDDTLILTSGARRATALERQSGFMSTVLARYPLRAGDLIVIISSSGRNAACVETALYARERGVGVIAITSVEHSSALPASHASGLRLMDAADIVLDNGAIQGDTLLALGETGYRVGSGSTMAGVLLAQALVCRAAELLTERGLTAPLWVSSNTAQGDALNEASEQGYAPRIPSL